MTVGRRRREATVVERWNRVFEAVAAEPRRRLVRSLAETPPDGSVALPESAARPGAPVDRDRLRQRLHHCHLPLLADAGYVEWESDPLVASRGPRFDEVTAVLDALRANAAAVPDPLVDGCRWLDRGRD